MAQYMAEVRGRRGAVHRLGDKRGGAVARLNGWDRGIEVVATWDERSQVDVFKVWRTSGSNGGPRELIAEVRGADVTLITP